jgi:hypothetical protein
LGDLLLDVLSMSIQRRGPSRPASPLGKGAAGDEVAHGAVVDGQLTSNTLHRAALGMQRHHLLVLRQAQGAAIVAQALPCAKSGPSRRSLPPQCRLAEHNLVSGLAHLWPEPLQHPFDVVSQVGQQVPAVADLLCGRQCGLDGLGVGAGAISGNDLDAGVGAQPIGHRSRFSAFEHFDRFTPLQVDNDCPVAVTPCDRPVVDADDSRCGHVSGVGRSAQLPQHGVGAGA